MSHDCNWFIRQGFISKHQNNNYQWKCTFEREDLMSSGLVPCGRRNSLLYSLWHFKLIKWLDNNLMFCKIIFYLYTDLPPPTSSCLAWTRSLLSTVFTIISSGAYSLTSNLNFSSFEPPSSSYFNIFFVCVFPFLSNLTTSLMRGDLSPWSQAECPPMAPVTPGRRSVSPDTSLTWEHGHVVIWDSIMFQTKCL